MNNWYNYTWIDVVNKLNSDSYLGLTDEQVQLHRKKYGDNEINTFEHRGVLSFIFYQLRQFRVLFFIITSFLFLYLNKRLYFYITLALAILDVFIVVYLKYKKQKSINELDKLNNTIARVFRNGSFKIVNSKELVVGDIVRLQYGDIVPADIRITETQKIRVNQSIVTGESYLVDKYSTKIEDKEISISQMNNMLFKCSKITFGEALGVVVSTGLDTEVSNIISKIYEEEKEKYSLKNNIEKIYNLFTLIMTAILALSMIIKYFVSYDLNDVLNKTSILMISFIPLSFMIILFLSAFIIIKKIKKKGILFKNISIVEKLSKVSIILIDKAGTLSENRVIPKKIYTNNEFVPLNEETLRIYEEFKEDLNVSRLIETAVLCNDTDFTIGDIKNSKNDLVEIALSEFAMRNGVNKNILEEQYRRVINIAYDEDKKVMTTINKIDTNYRAYVKGYLESILDKCTHIMKNGIEVEITEEDINKIKMADIKMAENKLSSIGFAYRSFNYEPSIKENIESNLVFIGTIGFENPIKEDIEDALNMSRYLATTPIIITKENKLSAYYIGKEISILSRLNQVISGVELENMSEEEFEDIVDKVKIFSRINYKQKSKIVKYYKNKGYITMIEGRKTIDLPSLKEADIAITTKENNILTKISDIVVSSGGLKCILSTIIDSRKIIGTIKNMIIYTITSLVTLFIFSLGLTYLGKEQLITNKILVINMLTLFVSLIAVVLQYEDQEYSLEHQDTIDKTIFSNNIIKMLTLSAVMVLITFISFKFTLIYSYGFAIEYSYFILNLLIVTLPLGFIKKFVYKNKVSNFLIVLAIVIPVIITAIFNLKLFNYLNFNVFKMFIGIFIGWIFILIFYRQKK